MANNNMTRLQAVNDMLRYVGIARVSALDSSGSWPSKTYNSSDAATAEYWLDIETQRFLGEGYGVNTTLYQVTLGAPGTITFADNVLSCKPIGKNQRRDIRFRVVAGTPTAYDNDNRTTTFAAGTYDFELIEDMDFVSLDVLTQQKVLAEAKRSFQQAMLGNQLKDQMLAEHQAKADVRAPRSVPPPSNRPANDAPLVAARPQQ